MSPDVARHVLELLVASRLGLEGTLARVEARHPSRTPAGQQVQQAEQADQDEEPTHVRQALAQVH